jgi:hypothetical protein
MNHWAAIEVERGRTAAIQRNMARIGVNWFIPMELAAVRRHRRTKDKKLVEYPVLATMVFVYTDSRGLHNVMTTKYTKRVVADQNEIPICIPDNQMQRFMDAVNDWNAGVRADFERQQSRPKEKRKKWRRDIQEALAEALGNMAGQERQAA